MSLLQVIAPDVVFNHIRYRHKRNNARLRSLGLISIAEERRSNDEAWRRQSLNGIDGSGDDGESSSSDGEYSEGNEKSSKKKKKSRAPLLPPREGKRKSRRLMQLPSEHAASVEDVGGDAPNNETSAERKERKERIKQERAALVEECREARQRAAIEVAKAGGKAAAKENPTATYEHCLMRVRSMTEKGLMNRVGGNVDLVPMRNNTEMNANLSTRAIRVEIICELPVCCSHVTTRVQLFSLNHRETSTLGAGLRKTTSLVRLHLKIVQYVELILHDLWFIIAGPCYRTSIRKALRGKDGNLQIVLAR